jgi:nucleotide-binding universal stress UspA family protein
MTKAAHADTWPNARAGSKLVLTRMRRAVALDLHLRGPAMKTADRLHAPSVQLKNILFAVDFLPGSLQAFPFAASIARHYDGRLLLEYVDPASETGKHRKSPPAARRTQSEIEAALAGVEDGLDDIPHEVLFDRGNICSKLLATARERHMDLIVVGTHGLRGMKKFVKGSTAEQIVLLASCPVLTAGPRVDRKADFRRILCAIELSPASEHAIPYALSLAEIYNASLIFLHVNDWSSNERPADAHARTYSFIHEQLQKSGRRGAMEARSRVKVDFGPRTDLILEAATDDEADLIVMGFHNGKGIRARIAAHMPGSMTYDVIAQAPCPVLTVPLPRAA